MTRDEARRRAVEAAIDMWSAHYRAFETGVRRPMEEAIATYERAMADAGWRMVRDVGIRSLLRPRELGEWGETHDRGWNACRAAMLGDE